MMIVRLFFIVTICLLVNVSIINNNHLISAGTQTEEAKERERQTPNNLPQAKNGLIEAESGRPVVINLAGYDLDSDERLTTQIESEPTYGSLTDFDKDKAIVTYTPNRDFEGTDVFSFTVSDGKTDSTPAEEVIRVSPPPNNPPEAIGGTVETVAGESTIINLGGVDPDFGQKLTTPIKKGPLHGKLTEINEQSSIVTYTSDPNYVGNDFFTFTVSDGELESEPAKVKINVKPPPNHPPEAGGGNVEVQSGGTIEVRLAASDPDSREEFTFHIQDEPNNGRLG